MHNPVLLNEVLDALNVRPRGKYIDATLGDGGHSEAILKKGGKLLAIDINEGSIKRAQERLSGATFVQGNFADIDSVAAKNGFDQVDGVIFDLGYSSSQIEDESVGLSFSKDQPLDMRLDKSLGVTAADLINALPEGELVRMFSEYGEEPHSKRIAAAIVARRALKKLETTKDLADLIVEVSPGRDRLHPATKVFQALRIAVNQELVNLETALPRTARLLLPGGRMAIISFHSLEDRIVKQFGLGVQTDLKAVSKKPILPSADEVAKNPRARSAKLRVFEKI